MSDEKDTAMNKLKTLLKKPKTEVAAFIYENLPKRDRKRIFAIGLDTMADDSEIFFAVILMKAMSISERKEAKEEEAKKSNAE